MSPATDAPTAALVVEDERVNRMLAAHALGLNVVAEGVETAGQRDVLHALGCDELQGFLFAKPMLPHLMALWAEGVGRPESLSFGDSAYVAVDEAPSLESGA